MTAPALREAAHATTYLAHAQALRAAHGPGPWPDGGYPLPDIDTLTIADALGGELQGRSRGRIHEIGKWLACNGTRRNAVAAGMVLIGLSGTIDDRELLLLLGGMEELTLYAVVALGRIASDDDRDWMIFELARRVRAWGRIHSVERLQGTRHKEIKAWLLREGFRNEVMNEYLAHIAATTGDLRKALEESEVDDGLLDGADLAECANAIWPAKKLGLRFQDRLGGWLTRDPANDYFWGALDDVGEVVDLASRLLPLRSLTTSPADHMGDQTDGVLETVVSMFTGHPGRGWPLVKGDDQPAQGLDRVKQRLPGDLEPPGSFLNWCSLT